MATSALQTKWNDIRSSARNGATPANDRKLAWLWATILIGWSLYSYFKLGELPNLVWPGLGFLLLMVGLLVPICMRPLTLFWFGLSAVLHEVTNPILLGIVFYGMITPMGLIRSFFVKRKSTNVDSYWVIRETPGPDPATLRNQF